MYFYTRVQAPKKISHLTELIRSLLCSLIVLVMCHSSKAQLLHTPTFIDNTLVNSPASLGTLQQERIQMSTFSYMDEFRFPSAPRLRDVLTNSDDQLFASDIRRFFFLAYHYSQSLTNNTKITVGLQLQTTNLNTARVSAPNTYGITINYHKRFESKRQIEKYLSGGIQMNLIHQKPRRIVTNYAYNNLIDDPRINLDAFHRQFSKAGFQYTLNAAWLRYRPNRSIIAIGASGSAVISKSVNSFGGITTGSFNFNSILLFNGHLFFNGQFTSGGRFMLNFDILTGASNSANSVGFGFKLKNDKVMRIAAVTIIYGFTGDRSEDRGVVLTYEASKFSYSLHFTNPFDSEFSFSQFDSTIQLGATYNMGQESAPTLLDRKY